MDFGASSLKAELHALCLLCSSLPVEPLPVKHKADGQFYFLEVAACWQRDTVEALEAATGLKLWRGLVRFEPANAAQPQERRFRQDFTTPPRNQSGQSSAKN